MHVTWQDTEEIAVQLTETHPDIDPLTVRFTDLHIWITTLPGFKDDPKKSNEKLLEAIQMAWWQEYKDARS
jgi:FeS assembly protein IscX